MVSSNHAPKRSLIKVLVMWNVALTVLVLIGMALYASAAQAANDPPIRVYHANADDVGGDGSSGVTNATLASTNPTQLRIVTTSNLGAAHGHTCIVVASAAAQHSSGQGTYIFGVSMDNPNSTSTGSNRLIEMFDNAGINDDNYEEVSTVYVYENVMGSHDFRFSGRKQSAGASNLEVDSSSMAVICLKKNIGPLGPAPVAEE